MLFARDDAGRTYTVSGNDRSSYDNFISRVQAAQKSGRRIDVDDQTAKNLENYRPGIFSDYGILGRR